MKPCSLPPLVPSLAVAALASLAGAFLTPVARAGTPGCATVEVSNVRPQQGYLMVAAYGDAESFGKKPITSLRIAAGDTTMSFPLCGLSGEAVALTLYQDLDGDGKLNRNIVGMPTEPWGGSGSPGAMGPSWDKSRVPLDGRALVVRMSQ
jgi:uncharacterized protein (DUF2141 family)